MKKQIILLVALLLLLGTPLAQADNVTVHGTTGMLEAHLVDQHTLEQVGTVEVWNRAMDINVVVKPFSDRCVLSQVSVYLDTVPVQPPVPEAYPELVSDYGALLEDCQDLADLADPPPEWLEEYQQYLAESQSDENVDESFEDLLKAYTALVGKYEELASFWGLAANPDYRESVAEYEASLVQPEYGEWPYGAKFKKNPPDQYVMPPVQLSELAALQWGQWGEPWLQKRLVTVAVWVELKTTDVVPVTFTAWALNPNVSTALQKTAWGDNALAMRYELQHPKHGTFVGPVHGMGYSTPTHNGTIGAEGGFSFFPGEIIELSIGSVYIGSAVADQRISPLDIFPGLEILDPAVVNLARLLLSLDGDEVSEGPITITEDSAGALQAAMEDLDLTDLDFGNTGQMDALIAALGGVSAEYAQAWLDQSIGSRLVRRNISKSPEYAVDKPKLDIMPVWVPARTADGQAIEELEYRDEEGNVVGTRNKVKPLFVTYTEEQEPNLSAGITRRGSDIITAVSMDDGATWKRFNVSHMARKSSFTLETGEKFPGDSRGPRQKIVDDKIMVVWTSAYARGGKPSFAIKTDDDYPYDDAYAVNDVWGVRGRQGSVDYDEDKDVGDQGIGEIPYYALWACRGELVWEGNAGKYPGREIGDVVWFKPERLTSGRRDAFFAMLHGARGAGFAIAWQEDPGGLLPGSCKGGGHGWSGATVHKKTDIWYSYIKIPDFELIDENWDPDAAHSADELELGDTPDEHGQQPEISNRPKWLVPMSLPVRVSDNSVVNTENLKVVLDENTGLPVIDPVTGGYILLDGAVEEDYLATDHEGEGGCDDGDHDDGDGDHGGNSGRGGGWGMARYAYELPELGILDLTLPIDAPVWDEELVGDYRPDPAVRWTRFINKAGALKTVAVTADGRPLDGNTGACRPSLQMMSGGWVILGYEETKGLGIPPEGEHGEDDDATRPEPDDKGKNIIYHSFNFTQPDRVSAGNILNLPALDDGGNLIPIYYKNAEGESTGIFRQYKTEVARRVRFIAQPKGKMGASRTVMLATYKQGREGSGKPSDVFVIRGVVPTTDTKYDNPYRFSNFVRYDTG
ncbi:MAG: choice-of-anchor O protein, partial [Desulfobacterales bacterium]